MMSALTSYPGEDDPGAVSVVPETQLFNKLRRGLRFIRKRRSEVCCNSPKAACAQGSSGRNLSSK